MKSKSLLTTATLLALPFSSAVASEGLNSGDTACASPKKPKSPGSIAPYMVKEALKFNNQHRRAVVKNHLTV